MEDKEARKKIIELEELKKRRTRMELEIIEATQEDYDKVCKHIKELENNSEVKKIFEEESSLSTLTFKYNSDYDGRQSTCTFDICFPENIDEEELCKIILEVKDWVDERVPQAKEKCRMNKKEKAIELVIKGQGPDGRCKWCRSFRTGLNERLRKDNLCKIRQNNSCKFDELDYENVSMR